MIYGKVEINGEPAPDGTEVVLNLPAIAIGPHGHRCSNESYIQEVKTTAGSYCFYGLPSIRGNCRKRVDKGILPIEIVVAGKLFTKEYEVTSGAIPNDKWDIELETEMPINMIAEAIRELADKDIVVDVDVDTTAIAEALTEVNIEIKDLVEISNAITNMATGIENLDITNIINIGETAKKLQATAKELEGTARKLEATERGS